MARCPTCGQVLDTPQNISLRAASTLEYMRKEAPKRGGYMFEGARPSFENGTYKDSELSELLAARLILPHPDPKKGWVVTTK